jgi:acyl dehydratase
MSAPFIDEFSVGQEAPVRRHVLRRTDLVRYAGASGDYNPMHHDEVLAKAAGQPSVFGHGMFSMGFLASAITDFVGIGRLVDYSVRFSRQTWPDEELVTHVAVTAVREEDGVHLVDLEVNLANQDGEVKVLGTASASVPERG